MKKRAIIGAFCACAILMTGCGTTNMPRKYKKELDYTLGNYTIALNQELSKDGYKEWDVNFTTKNGGDIATQVFTERYDKSQKKYFDSHKELDDYEYWNFYNWSMNRIASGELEEKVLNKHFGINNDDISICFTFIVSAAEFGNPKAEEAIYSYISPKTGRKLSEMDLKSIACDETVGAMIMVTLNEDVDPEPYVERMKLAIADYESLTGSPMNYTFTLKKKAVEESSIVYNKSVLFGEEFDFYAERDKAKAKGESYNLRKAIANVLFPQ